MDADKMSRSGRKVKTPHKFQDMEVVDPLTGRRTITSSPMPQPPKVKVAYTGRRRGRPPRTSSSYSPQPTDESGQHFDEYYSEEDSSDGVFPMYTSDDGANGFDTAAGNSTGDGSSNQGGNIHSVSASGGLNTLGLAGNTKYSPVLPNTTVKTANIQLSRSKRPRKRPVPFEEGGPAKRRRPPASSKIYDGQVDIPDGLLEAMRKKRQVTAYLVFCRAERPSVIRDFPDGDFSQFSKELGNRWNALSESEKYRWRHISNHISKTIQSERGTDPELPERARKARDKVIRDLDNRMIEPPCNSAFDLVSNLSVVGEQFANMANCVNFVSFTPGSQEPMGCLDAVMDSALVIISSTLGLMAQVPILRDSLDVDVFDDIAENSGMVMPLVHFK